MIFSRKQVRLIAAIQEYVDKKTYIAYIENLELNGDGAIVEIEYVHDDINSNIYFKFDENGKLDAGSS